MAENNPLSREDVMMLLHCSKWGEISSERWEKGKLFVKTMVKASLLEESLNYTFYK
jgi:hypothetical protein